MLMPLQAVLCYCLVLHAYKDKRIITMCLCRSSVSSNSQHGEKSTDCSVQIKSSKMSYDNGPLCVTGHMTFRKNRG